MTQFPQLSNREWEVVKLLLQGKSNKLIASSLGISDRTVEFHLKNIYAKFQVNSRIELILKLGNTTGEFEIEKLGRSTVVEKGETAENSDMPNLWMIWAITFKETVSIIGKELNMNTSSENSPVLKQPSAWIPLVMSLAALAMILGYVAIFGIVHNQDEGAPAHIFQLIMIAQLPIAAYFAFKWLPKRPVQAMGVLALQVVGWVIPIITIIWLESL